MRRLLNATLMASLGLLPIAAAPSRPSEPPRTSQRPSVEETPAPPPFKLLRYQEDYRGYAPARREDGSLVDPLDAIKYLPFDPAGRYYLSLGGDLRARYEYFRNPGFGLGSDAGDTLLLRALVHADLHLTPRFRTFVQLVSLGSLGHDADPSPLDINAFDLQQGFAELRFDELPGAHALTLRAGRQEVVLGSGRLVAIRKGPNFRRSFDMGRVQWSLPKGQIDALGGTTVRPGAGVLDDRADTGDALWGLYGTGQLLEGGALGLDGYYLGVRRAERVFQDAEGVELRHSLGARVFGRYRGLDYNYEGIVQVGSVGESSLLAWTFASDTGYTIRDGRTRARFGLRADVTSGDRAPGDGRIETFDALYPNLKYFSEAGLIVPSNHVDLHPALTLGFDRVTLTADWNFFWRTQTADAIYRPPGFVLFDAASSDHRFVGHQITTELGVPLGRHFKLTLYYAHFFRGAFISAAGGRDVDFLGGWIEHTF